MYIYIYVCQRGGRSLMTSWHGVGMVTTTYLQLSGAPGRPAENLVPDRAYAIRGDVK